MPKSTKKIEKKEEISDKFSLLALVKEGYSTSDSYRSINTEFKTHQFIGRFHDMDMIETKFGISNRYTFKKEGSDDIFALLSSSKNLHSIFIQHVVKAGPIDISIWKDSETGFWMLDFV